MTISVSANELLDAFLLAGVVTLGVFAARAVFMATTMALAWLARRIK